MPDNKFIQSVLAGSIMDADFFRTLQLKTIKDGTDALSFKKTLKGLKFFSGFIAKVQHNFLWTDFKLTRKMMMRQKIELEIFTAYLPEHQNNKRLKVSKQDDKILRFVVFLKNYLAQRTQQRYRLVYNILLHEEAMFLLKQGVNLAEKIDAGRLKISSIARPGICGAVRHVLMDVHPGSLSDCFKPGAAKLIRRRRKYYSYWYDPHTPAVRILEMPAIMRRVLFAVDNKKKIKDIVQHCAVNTAPEDTRMVLEHLHKMKMITLN